MTIEIVDLPLEMVDLSIVFCKRLPEAITNSHSESRLVSKMVKDNMWKRIWLRYYGTESLCSPSLSPDPNFLNLFFCTSFGGHAASFMIHLGMSQKIVAQKSPYILIYIIIIWNILPTHEQLPPLKLIIGHIFWPP